jgi:aryl-alcohol dehydrogenase-like predicted oxidoreductase
MEYSILGKTGRKVSRIGFGGATAGILNYIQPFDPREKNDRDKILAAIRRAYQLGINYFDTAESYGAGASEEIFGEGLECIKPEDIFLATKVTPFGERGLRSAGQIRAALEASLRRLRRDYIDLIQIHGSYYSKETSDAILSKGGVADALTKARDEGLVKHIGFSIETQNTALDNFIACGRFDMLQIEYNLLFQHPYDPSFKIGSLYQAEEAGLGISVMRTMTSGIFQKWIRQVNPTDTFDYGPALLQFVLSNPLVDTALIGMRDAAQVEQNAAVADDLTGRIDINEMHRRLL